MKIPFDIKYRKQIESGEYKVVTRDGRAVTEISFDNDYHGVKNMIYATCKDENYVCIVDETGHARIDGREDDDDILILNNERLFKAGDVVIHKDDGSDTLWRAHKIVALNDRKNAYHTWDGIFIPYEEEDEFEITSLAPKAPSNLDEFQQRLKDIVYYCSHPYDAEAQDDHIKFVSGKLFNIAKRMLEKENYEKHMQPIYDDIESFEQALDIAWKSYDEGYRIVDSMEDDYTECAFSKGFREGYLCGLQKKEEKK